MVTKTLAPGEVKKFLKALSAAIEVDQVWVDGLPPERFSTTYSESMWRAWRRDHRVFIGKLISTADAMPPAMLNDLTEIATAYEPSRVGRVMLELLAEIVGGCCAEDFGTSEHFFSRLINEVREQRKGSRRSESAQALILQWMPATDPLRIDQDPECGYGQGRVG